MDRRAFIGTLAGGILPAPLVAEAESDKAVRKLGLINVGAPERPWRPPIPSPFWDRLQELGWREGQTLQVERRGGPWDRIAYLASELARLKVDVIMVPTGGEALRAYEGTRTVPICAAAGDLQAEGLVRNLRKPETNVTGVQVVQVELVGKRLALLKEVVPGLTQVGVLLEGPSPTNTKTVDAAEEAARKLRLKLHVVTAGRPEMFADTLASLTDMGVRGLMVVNNPGLLSHLRQLVALVAQTRLVAIYDFRYWVEGAGLMSYGPLRSEIEHLWAECVDKILRGAKPADVPVQQPTKFEFAINLKTAKALGLTIPPSLLQRADQVIE